MADVTIPQFDAPFRLDDNGLAVVVEQNSPSDVAACVYNVLTCPVGDKLGDPSFGVPSLLFSTVPLNTAGILAAIQRLEPRVAAMVSDTPDAVGQAVRDVLVQLGVQGTPTAGT